jgi:uncharacterized membrane-anchored protein YhcB (DUF1043 family)
MRTKSTVVVSGKRVEADDVVIALINRLMKVEKQLAGFREELNDHMEIIAEQIPKLRKDGQVVLRAMSSDMESLDKFVVTVASTEVVPDESNG